MTTLAISLQLRPHNPGLCWCRPRQVLCECEQHTIEVHRFVEVRPDLQPRMTAYSS